MHPGRAAKQIRIEKTGRRNEKIPVMERVIQVGPLSFNPNDLADRHFPKNALLLDHTGLPVKEDLDVSEEIMESCA